MNSVEEKTHTTLRQLRLTLHLQQNPVIVVITIAKVVGIDAPLQIRTRLAGRLGRLLRKQLAHAGQIPGLAEISV